MSYTENTQTLPWKSHAIYTWRLTPDSPQPQAPVVVMMHGAGTADSTRARGLAETFANNGVSVISLDFVGHGKTGGDMQSMSLKLRTELALAVINHLAQPDEQLVLCGFSMSGHTVLRLSEQLGSRVTVISIMAPGIYAREAEEVSFGPEFSSIIRQENSWQNSLALDSAQKFRGKVHMLMSSHDEVIPWGVPEHLLQAFRQNATEVRFTVLQEPDHKVAVWLSEHPDYGRELLRYLV